MTKLCLRTPEVQAILESVDVTKAAGPDKITARLLKERGYGNISFTMQAI